MDVTESTRLAALEARVSALEGRGGDDGPAPEHEPATSEVFWVLNGVKARHPGPGAVLFAGSASTPGGESYEYQYGLETEHLLDLDWSSYADSLAALGHPVRLAILRAVAGGTETVAGLVEELGLGTSGQMYHHVNQLEARGWLTAHARSRFRIPPARMIPLLAILTAAAGGS